MHGKALVLGGRTGLLGQALMQVLTARGWETQPLGREDGDLLDAAELTAMVEKAAPDVIFNTIAWTQVDNAEDNPAGALQWNRAFPAQLARIVKGHPIHLIHYSTDFVFTSKDHKNGMPFTEDAHPNPTSVYGKTKYEGEQAVMSIAPEQSCILRTAWLFGPGRKNFITTILDACHKKDSISVVHDQIGSPTYSLDLALWSALAAEKELTGLYHAVNSGRASWCDLACEAISLTAAPCRISPITTDQWPQKAPRPLYSVLNTDRLSAAIGVSPRAWPLALREYIFNNFPQPE